MTNNTYREGKIYFRLTFSDAGLIFPKIETFVFVGKNLSDEDTEDTWYFQFADSYSRFGSVRTSAAGDRKVCRLLIHDLSEMLDLPNLMKELESAERRRNEIGRNKE
jgi:hypothetical protein